MRIYLFSLTIFISITCFSQQKKLIEIRSCFRSIEGVNEIKKLINLSKNINDHPVILAYNYTGKLMMLDYSNNPFEKYKIFKTKTKQIDSIINTNQKNIEIRLLRYALQQNSPYFQILRPWLLRKTPIHFRPLQYCLIVLQASPMEVGTPIP